MAVRLFFDLAKGSRRIRDRHGVDAPNVREAGRLVSAVIDEMHDAREFRHLKEGWKLEIRDERNVVWHRLLIT